MERQFSKISSNLARSQSWNAYIKQSIQCLFRAELTPETLNFFCLMSRKNLRVFEELRATLEHYCKEDGLFLTASHIDTVIKILQKQRDLPANIETLLQTDFDSEAQQKMTSTIATLRKKKLPWLNTQAKTNNYGHHTLYHASEIKVRAMRAAKTLGLFEAHSVLGGFQSVVKFAIEFHDFIQGKPGSTILGKYATAELATAAAVKSWLLSTNGSESPAKSLDKLPANLKYFIDLLIDNSIVLATTLIFSKQKPQHLASIFTLFENKAREAGMQVVNPTNAHIINEIQAMNVVIGTCDVLAASIHTVVQQQLSVKKTNSLDNLKTYFSGERLILEDFFASREFVPYFPDQPISESYEAFLMTNVPHLQMGAELKILPTSDAVRPFALSETSDHASMIITFIRNCQKVYRENHIDFKTYFEREYNIHLSEAVINVFFSHIESEIEFITSLVSLITQGEKKLHNLQRINEEGQSVFQINTSSGFTTHRFIDPEVPDKDARNLSALSQFFNAPDTNKHQLIKEFLVNAVLQAGATYIACPELADYSASNTPLNCMTPMNQKGLGNYVSSCSSGLFHTSSFSIADGKAWIDTSEETISWDEYETLDEEYDSNSDIDNTSVKIQVSPKHRN